jgi:hypothetical protein
MAPPRRARLIGVEFLAATGVDAANGEVSLFKGGRVRVRGTGLENGSAVVDSVSIGLPGGATGTQGGAFLIDDYRSSP